MKNEESTVQVKDKAKAMQLRWFPLIILLMSLLLLFGCQSVTTGSAEDVDAVEEAVTYAVGDTGPAGGLVFYDKGQYSEGWRYLESAPPESEVSLQWGSHGSDLNVTSHGIGEGRGNTGRIAEAIRELEMRPQGATYCEDLVIGGFDDWFLPSLDELDLIFWSLAQKDLGTFQKEGYGYWSSSEFDENFAWAQGFSEGVQGKIEKTELFLVRAVRAF
ncbi:MAG: DUF1566 domain-containing protein [Sphaerochaetaceae bacterium]|nr:DUF1566 domain-containing protein [Sphaerochaetaceae bacterium]